MGFSFLTALQDNHHRVDLPHGAVVHIRSTQCFLTRHFDRVICFKVTNSNDALLDVGDAFCADVLSVPSVMSDPSLQRAAYSSR